jgi:hypothetical protein
MVCHFLIVACALRPPPQQAKTGPAGGPRRCGNGPRQSGKIFVAGFIAALKRCATQKQKRVLNCTVASPLVVVARSATLRRGEAVSGWGRTELGIGSVRRTLDK